jgi:N6-adenosine-specific RNA methylase IME4
MQLKVRQVNVRYALACREFTNTNPPSLAMHDHDKLKHIGQRMNKKTGYSIYNAEAKQRTKQNNLPEFYPALPGKKFDIIYADPPWHYNGKMQFDKTGKGVEEIDLSKKIFISSAVFKYPTLRLDELKAIPVSVIAKDDCLLFMWTTNPHLAQAIELGKEWGFEYKTVAFVWDKMKHNPGQYTLSNCELCLLFKRGRIPRPRGARNIQQLVRLPRGEHSAKPIEVATAIERMFPTQKRIELFARIPLEGWESWGLDLARGLGDAGTRRWSDTATRGWGMR